MTCGLTCIPRLESGQARGLVTGRFELKNLSRVSGRKTARSRHGILLHLLWCLQALTVQLEEDVFLTVYLEKKFS